MQTEATYICGSCGEEIVVPLDICEGEEQQFIEDCPVCCCPNVIHVVLHGDGSATASAEPE